MVKNKERRSEQRGGGDKGRSKEVKGISASRVATDKGLNSKASWVKCRI